MRKIGKKTMIKLMMFIIPVIMVAFLFVQSYTMAYYTDNKEASFRIDVELLTYELSSSSPSFDSSNNTITVSGQTSVDVSLYIGSTNSIESKYNLNYIVNSGTNISCVYKTGDLPTGILPAYWEPSHALSGVSVNLRCSNKSAAIASVKLYVDGGYTDETIVLPSGRETIQEEVRVVQVSAKENHTATVTNEGTIYAWGWNSQGQIGDGTQVDKLVPTLISGISNVKQVSAGQFYTVAITNDGKVYIWGRDKNLPTLVSGINDVKQVSAGEYYTIALTTDGQVYQVNYSSLTSTLISGINNVKQISMSVRESHIVAVTNASQIYAWGQNTYGKIGDGTTAYKSVPTLISGISDVKQVSAGNDHTVAVTNAGQVYAWGHNSFGSLGDGTSAINNDRLIPTLISGISDVKQVSAGQNYTVAVTNAGQVYAWGLSSAGQLGTGGWNYTKNVPTLINGINNIKELSTGFLHTVALTNDGKIYAWGNNDNGQLGDGTTYQTGNPRLIPFP